VWGGVIAATALATAVAFALLTRALPELAWAAPRRNWRRIGVPVDRVAFARPPHVLALPLLVIWMSGVIRARDEGHVPSLLLLPVMTLLVQPARRLCRRLAVRRAARRRGGARSTDLGSPAGVARLGRLSRLVRLRRSGLPQRDRPLTLPLHLLQMGFATGSISEWRSVDFAISTRSRYGSGWRSWAAFRWA